MGNKDIGKLSKLGNEQRQLKLSSKQRSEIASIAAKARWDKYGQERCEICGAFRLAHNGRISHQFQKKI